MDLQCSTGSGLDLVPFNFSIRGMEQIPRLYDQQLDHNARSEILLRNSVQPRVHFQFNLRILMYFSW